MKSIHWLTLAIGYLIGSFFGISVVFGMFNRKPAAAPAGG